MKVNDAKALGERLRKARMHAGLTIAQAAEAFGQKLSTYTQNDNGTRGFGREKAEIYARRFKVSLEWLMTGKGPMVPGRGRTLKVLGFVGGGAAIHELDEHGRGDSLDEIDAPPGTGRDAAAVVVRGDSMWPAVHDGEIIVYDEPTDDPARLIGRKVVVKVVDGRMLVKMLRRGSLPGFWSLDSFNGPPIENVELLWAAPITAILSR